MENDVSFELYNKDNNLIAQKNFSVMMPEINANSNECNGLYYLKGLTTVDQKWKNIFYPYYEEETIF